MKLNKDYKYLILCEDKLTQCFIRYFLINQGIKGRKIYPLPLPAAGCGEQFVRTRFPNELKNLRSRNFDANILVVAIDADNYSPAQRKEQLNEACINFCIESIRIEDKILLFVPKRNIETWVKYFDGENVDETTDYAHFLNGHESDCYSSAVKMSDEFAKENMIFELNSINEAYKEYTNLLKKIV